MEKTAAVIGGSGFVGRAIVEMLARAGWRVVVLCRNAERAKFLKPMGVVGQVSVVSGNALSDTDLEQVIAPAILPAARQSAGCHPQTKYPQD